MPRSLSFVDKSAPSNFASRPRRFSTATLAIAYPGATRPQIWPQANAHSPMAKMSSSEVRHEASTTMPPRGPVARPALRPRSSRGRMPAEKTIMSTGRSRPSANPSARTTPSSATTDCVWAPTWILTPRASTRRRRAAPPRSSTWTGMSRGAISTTCVSRPSRRSAWAASSPSRPPPMTAPTFDRLAHASICIRSSIVR